MKKTILIVDDDASVRNSVAQVINAEGHQVLLAANGCAAIELVKEHRIDLAILDLNMPGKGGWDTFEHLTNQNPTLPIIIITGRSNQQFTALAAGVGALLEKPFEMKHLLAEIRRLLEQPPTAHLARLAGKRGDTSLIPANDDNR